MTRATFMLASAAIVLLAAAIREWFVLSAIPADPAFGEAATYLRYAQHLAWDGTFSRAGNGEPVVPDAFLGPGYPALLAVLWTEGADWFARVHQVQVALGAATVACVIALARQWLSRGWSLVAGGWMAVQPHHVVATGAVLPEIATGLAIISALLAASLAQRRGSMPMAIVAGALLGAGYLVDPVLALLPLPLALLMDRRRGLAMVVVAALAIGGWAARNASHDARADEATKVALVKGAWPEYHDAWRYPFLFEQTPARMGAEIESVLADDYRPLLDRLGAYPGHFAAWYLSKPFLLFDWDIRIGQGGFYTIPHAYSPMDAPLPLALAVVQWKLNPVLFALAFIGLVLAVAGRGTFVAVAVVYVTLVHVVLQAEPRYAIPYRSLEILLAVSAMAYLWDFLPRTARPGRGAHPGHQAGTATD